mmetsp:Transcript_19389/g.45866  ORF Transcript_19389/g.45866 Transcript_19389/m.45866 type:complete len:210 (+) Transcript_19389:1572-2201(+)
MHPCHPWESLCCSHIYRDSRTLCEPSTWTYDRTYWWRVQVASHSLYTKSPRLFSSSASTTACTNSTSTSTAKRVRPTSCEGHFSTTQHAFSFHLLVFGNRNVGAQARDEQESTKQEIFLRLPNSCMCLPPQNWLEKPLGLSSFANRVVGEVVATGEEFQAPGSKSTLRFGKSGPKSKKTTFPHWPTEMTKTQLGVLTWDLLSYSLEVNV